MARADADARPARLTALAAAAPPGSRPASSKPAAASRPARPAARRVAKPRGKPAGRVRLWLALLPRHWLAVGVIVLVLIVGIPLAHAMVGDLGALLLLTGIGGFALGRATAKHDIPGTRLRTPRRREKGE